MIDNGSAAAAINARHLTQADFPVGCTARETRSLDNADVVVDELGKLLLRNCGTGVIVQR